MAEVAAIILAAGLGSRFGAGRTKVVADLDGTPMVRRVTEVALASQASPVIVVTGHAAAEVAGALAGSDVALVHNAAFASGMAGSLKIGIDAVPDRCAAALVLLADMPLVRSEMLDALIDAFARQATSPDAVVPVYAGRPGNPVLLCRRLFADIRRLDGDSGARGLLAEPGRHVLSLPVGDPGVVVDVDTGDDMRRLRGDG